MKKSNFSKVVIGIGILIIGLLIATFILNRPQGDIRLVYIGNAEFEAILDDDSGEGAFVYIGRLTCPACTALRPVIETLPGFNADLDYFETDMAMAEDAEWTAELGERVELRGVPTIVYIENGVVIDRLVGVQDVPTLTDFFDRNGGLD